MRENTEPAPSQTSPSLSYLRYASDKPHSIGEFDLYKPRPGHPDWSRLALEAKELAAEIGPTLERPRRGWVEAKRRALATKSYLSGYWLNRRRHRSGRGDFLPFILHWTANRSCNFSCQYCDDHQGNKYPDLSDEGVLDTENAKKLLRVMRTRASALYVAGGEPTMRADLPQLVRTAKDLAYYPILVNTNASLFHRLLKRREWRTFLADVDQVIVSLDAFNLGFLKEMYRYKRPQDVIRNLLLLRELADAMRFKLHISTVIQPGYVDEASDLLDFANDLGIHFLPVPVNVGPSIDPTIKDDNAYKELAGKILERKRAGYPITGSLRLNRRMLFSEPLNCRTTLKPQVDFDGKMFWPCKATVNVKPETVDVLSYDSVDDLYRAASERVDATGFHGPAKNQCGASCNWAQYYMTDDYLHGLEHPMSMARQVLQFVLGR